LQTKTFLLECCKLPNYKYRTLVQHSNYGHKPKNFAMTQNFKQEYPKTIEVQLMDKVIYPKNMWAQIGRWTDLAEIGAAGPWMPIPPAF